MLYLDEHVGELQVWVYYQGKVESRMLLSIYFRREKNGIDLIALSVIRQSRLRVWILERSALHRSAEIQGFFTIYKILLSSANSFMSQVMPSVMPFMYIRNNRDPSMKSCSIPTSIYSLKETKLRYNRFER